ncbi:MAG: alpha/beta hydrolase [Deltaproteobacteria bacterium]|nr:alpha/beta hydrolase [Deltaproteobacteria bacterium]
MNATLSHALIHPAHGAAPTEWIYFLHGILGSGANWRSFAKTLVSQRPHVGAVLVDLRMHGSSQDFAAPHTVAACVEDLAALDATLSAPVAAVIGHSFGGKVALAYAAHREQISSALRHAIAVDSNPGVRDPHRGNDELTHVIDALETLPKVLASRADFVSALGHQGLSAALIAWLSMNLRPRPNHSDYELRTDLAAIRTLLADYFAQDLWHTLEEPRRTHRSLIIGGKSAAFDQADRTRALRAAEASPDHVRVEVIAEAAHWVHVDAPEELLRICLSSLASADRKLG